jgi:FPC/CPF motif-containing protein YcgG
VETKTLSGAADFAAAVHVEFAAFVADSAFPCLGAKAALNAGSYELHAYEELGSAKSSAQLHSNVLAFTRSDLVRAQEYASFIAVFRSPVSLGETEFEQLLWSQLQRLHALDDQPWDPLVDSDPASPRFSFSLGGQALYVVGLHGGSSRLARRFPWPALVFNPHEQFEKLRSDGKWKRMQNTIRRRDVALQGSVNPMLDDFGETSEARQYSGRAVQEDWKPPFEVAAPTKSRCPFAH